MEPGLGGGFFSLPWPNAARVTTRGSLDLKGLPGAGYTLTEDRQRLGPLLAPHIVGLAGQAVSGFGTNSAVYFQATVPLDRSSLPTPEGSLTPSASVQLIDTSTGERAPVLVAAREHGDRYRPDHLVSVLPYPGHPLRPSTQYAVMVFGGVRSSSGETLRPAGLLDDLDGPWDGRGTPTVWNQLRLQRREVGALVGAFTSWDPARLVAFTVFRTQDVRREMGAVARSIRSSPAPVTRLVVRQKCPVGSAAAARDATALLVGTIELARWQDGDAPYLWDGGDIVVDRAGRAVRQGTALVPLTVRVPCGAPPPDGWPVVAFVNGTGAGTDLAGVDAPPFGAPGWVVAEIPPSFGRGRDDVTGVTRWVLEQLGVDTPLRRAGLLFYNLLNPRAARTNPIQQAADHLGLLMAAARLQIAASDIGSSYDVRVDRSIRVAAGHSQGAQTLPLVANADPTITGVVSSAGSGGQYHTVSHLIQQRNEIGLLAGDVSALDELNPLVQVVQTLTEAGDGINYPSSQHYLNIAGRDDTCVAFETARHLAGGLGLGIANRQAPASMYGSPQLDPPTVALPARGNANGATRVSVELPGGHFVAYDHTDLADHFLADLATRDTPTIGPVPDTGGRDCGSGGSVKRTV